MNHSADDAIRPEARHDTRKIVQLHFPPSITGEPIVCNLVRLFDLCFSIKQAMITPRKEGFMVLELMGQAENFQKGLEYLRQRGVKILPAAQKVTRLEESCTHCGVCTALCLTGALSLDLESRRVIFDPERCTACGLCTRVCPVRAMAVDAENGVL